MLKLSLITILFIISGCQTSPPKIPVCVEISMARGYCINTITGEEFEVNETKLLDGKTWWNARTSMVMMPATSWAKLKTYIITQCKKTKLCDKEISSWNRTIQSVDTALEAKQ